MNAADLKTLHVCLWMLARAETISLSIFNAFENSCHDSGAKIFFGSDSRYGMGEFHPGKTPESIRRFDSPQPDPSGWLVEVVD